ncbi:MAG: FAD-dependent monooxygenase [Acidobacteria bacterium]|nr:FAD-dependent monooxygenase [Acidobacteriota bacterium]
MPDPIPIIGGGPAGAAAALAIARGGGRPVIYEKSRFPRQKLCGEFFTPEALPVLEELGVADGFLSLRPARVTHAELNFARRHRRFPLPEAGCGLSRYAFDDFLLRAAVERGAKLRPERLVKPSGPAVWAVGRSIISTRGRRAFGFKAHFSGPANDAVEIYFFDGGYCGLCPIEGGKTNVCGLACENLLFDVDRLLCGVPRLAARLAPLERLTLWHIAGPLRFGMPASAPGLLAAGDAACFVDPFTGSGLLGAVQTGAWAGAEVLDAAQGLHWSRCCARQRRRCAGFYRRQLATTVLIRRALDLGFAESIAGLLPGSLLFRLTRPG